MRVKMAFEKVKCKECGAIFQPKNKKQKFCSHKCAVKYNRRNGSIEAWRFGGGKSSIFY
jgi:uncharacterized OB-fold protein